MREFNQSQNDELILFNRSTDELCDDVQKFYRLSSFFWLQHTTKSTQQPKNIEMFHRADKPTLYYTTTMMIKSSSIHSVIRFKFNVDGMSFFAAVPNPSSLLFAFKQTHNSSVRRSIACLCCELLIEEEFSSSQWALERFKCSIEDNKNDF